MKPVLPSVLIALLVAAPSVAGQELISSRFDAASVRPAVHVPVVALSATTEAPPAEASSRSAFGFGSIAHAIGGALVGGWLGFVGSQVVLSDWDKTTDDSFRDQRGTWVAAGMVVGLLGSRVIGETGSPNRPLQVRESPRTSRSVITVEEIRGANVSNAYDLILSLRNEWLVTRGTNRWSETAQGSGSGMGPGASLNVTPGKEQIIVYMDDIQLGGVESLRDIPVDLLTGVEFVDARRATYLYGAGHTHGVIRLSSQQGG